MCYWSSRRGERVGLRVFEEKKVEGFQNSWKLLIYKSKVILDRIKDIEKYI